MPVGPGEYAAALAYLAAAAAIAVFIIWRSRDRMRLMDYAIIGVGGALISIADHVIGDAIYVPSPIYPFINPSLWFRFFVFIIVIGAVRKVGSGMLSMAVFDIVGDLLHFGFSGEPLWLIEDVLTYGFMADVLIFLTKDRLFGIGAGRYQAPLAVAEGAALGFAMSLVHPLFTYGFFAPIIKGFYPNANYIRFMVVSYIPGGAFISALAAIAANRVSKALRAGV